MHFNFCCKYFLEISSFAYSVTLNLLYGFNAQMISWQRNTALYRAYIAKSVVCCMLKRLPLQFGYCRSTHTLLPVYYPPTPSNPHTQQPIVECHILFLFEGSSSKESSTRKSAASEKTGIAPSLLRCLLWCILPLCICYITVEGSSNIHVLNSSILHRRWP